MVKLSQNDPKQKAEYDKILSRFRQTAKQQKIIEIERVQNPSLFKDYVVQKKSLDKKNGSNEMYLFHDTDAEKIKEINKKGLNRHLAGNTNGL